MAVNFGSQCDQLIVLSHIALKDHPAGQFQETAKIQSFISILFYDPHSLTEHSSGDQHLKKGCSVYFYIFAVIHLFQIMIQVLSLHMFCIIVQNVFADRISVFSCTSTALCQLLEICKVVVVHFCFFTVMQQQAGIFCSQFQKSLQHLFLIVKFLQIIMNCRYITPLPIVLKKDHCVLCINSRIGNSLYTWINFFLIQLAVSDDHLMDLRIITIQTVSKQSGGNFLCLFFCFRSKKKFLINSGIILIHGITVCLTEGKSLHGSSVIFVSSRRLCLISYDAGVNKSLSGISKCIVIVCKIHQKSSWKFSLIGDVHSLYIIFIKSGKAETLIHSKGKPSEIFWFPWLTFHNIFTDCFQNIIRRKLFITFYQCMIKTSIKFFFVAGQICHSHYDLFSKHFSSAGIMKYLHPERTHPVKKRGVFTNPLPGFLIKERTGTAFFVKFFHNKKSL